MARRTRRSVIWTLLVLFAALCAWWCLYFPFDAARLYRAIPREAVFVGEHERLAERWDEFSRNPLTRTLLVSAGIERQQVDALAEDRTVRDLVRRLGGRDTLVAYVPSLGAGEEPAWVLASWIGGTAQLLRWGLAGRNMERVRLDDGRRGWLVETGRKERLSLAVSEGVLVGCYSEDPAAVGALLRRMEAGAALRPALADRLREGGDGCLDRGWFGATVRHAGRKVPCALRYVLSAHDSAGSEGRVRGRMGDVALLPEGAGGDVGARISGLSALVGDAPDLVLAGPCAGLSALLAGPGIPAGVTAVRKRLESVAAPAASFCACLLGGDMSGRILGLRVPTLLLAMQVADAEAAQRAVADALDELNSRYGWSLLPRRVEEGRVSVVVLETGRGGVYASMGPRERPAYAVRDGWLLVASNMDALVKILGGPPKAAARASTWSAGLGDHPAAAYAWADVEAAGQAARNAMAVYSLALIAQNSPGSEGARRGLEDMKDWISTFAPLKTAAFWLASDNGELDLRFLLGQPARAKPLEGPRSAR
jgi:hypothetical protein